MNVLFEKDERTILYKQLKRLISVICGYLLLFILILIPFNVIAENKIKDTVCEEDDISMLYQLIYGNYLPFEPPLDDEGNVTLSDEQLFVMKSKHFFNQIKSKEPVRISLATYASLSGEVPEALSDFETKIKIVLPDCQIISLYRGSPIERLKARFSVIQEIAKIALDADLDAFVSFAANKLKPNDLTFKDILTILENDYAYDPKVIGNLMPKPMVDRYFPGKNIPVANLAEATILTFVARGGKVTDYPEEIFFVKPKSFSGVSENFSAIMVTDKGQVKTFSALNTDLIVQLFTRYGIKSEVLSIKEVFTDKKGSCNLDPAGRWFQLIGGRKIRNCPFFSLSLEMLRNRSYVNTIDYVEQSTNFNKLDLILREFVLKNSVGG